MKKTPTGKPIKLYVSTKGNDAWSGRLANPNRAGTDGPFATVRAAQQAVRERKASGRLPAPVHVNIRGGVYPLARPLVFSPADSGSPEIATWQGVKVKEAPVVYRAYRGERAVLSGGRRISGWRVTRVNGRTAWVADLPRVRRGKWYFRQLWVNGRRCDRPRAPGGERAVVRFVDVPARARPETIHRTVAAWQQARFRYGKGDIDPKWKNLQDVELVFYKCWVGSRVQLKSVDGRKRIATTDRVPWSPVVTGVYGGENRYIVENVFESLEKPGQWYLDRTAGKLYYLPRPGETPGTAEVVAPVAGELVRIEGRPGKGAKVESLRFEGVTFSHDEWQGSGTYSHSVQAAHQVPGAVRMKHARNVRLENCALTHLGGYGVELAEDCHDVDVRGCRIEDLGAGGVKIWHGCRRNRVADCEIGDGGVLDASAVGVLIGNATGNRVVHNHIHDFYYTGVSVGWTWGYSESNGYGNIVEWNHIHDLGKGLLSDMGGIYTLGVSPGTRLRYNRIHDVNARMYGGWGIYPDEGSSHILIENNLTYHTEYAGFSQHYGRENLVRNNIFALGRKDQVGRGRGELHVSFVFENNIVYFEQGNLFWSGYSGVPFAPENVVFRRNLYWDASKRRMRFEGRTFRQWQKFGMDAGSVIADPKFVNPRRGNFRFRKNAPYARIGFVPFDLSGVGPRTRV